MIRLFLLLFSSVLIQSLSAQEAVEVYEKEEGNNVLLVAKNNLDEAVEVTLNITYSGFVTKDVFPKKQIIEAKVETTLTTLKRPAQTECEYSISVSYKKVSKKTDGNKITRTTGIQINPVKVNVFTRDDCERCTFVIEQLEKNGVVFLELNTTLASSNKTLMFEKLKEAGYKDATVQMPVVYHNGELYYNIKDLKAFIKKFK